MSRWRNLPKYGVGWYCQTLTRLSALSWSRPIIIHDDQVRWLSTDGYRGTLEDELQSGNVLPISCSQPELPSCHHPGIISETLSCGDNQTKTQVPAGKILKIWTQMMITLREKHHQEVCYTAVHQSLIPVFEYGRSKSEADPEDGSWWEWIYVNTFGREKYLIVDQYDPIANSTDRWDMIESSMDVGKLHFDLSHQVDPAGPGWRLLTEQIVMAEDPQYQILMRGHPLTEQSSDVTLFNYPLHAFDTESITCGLVVTYLPLVLMLYFLLVKTPSVEHIRK